MDDDEPKPEKAYPISTAKMSKTPSWIMLGFLLGAAFVAALPPLRKQPAPEVATMRAVAPPKPAEPRDPPQLTTIEAVFAEWGKHAVWSDDVTEVALWNSRDKAYTDFYEVRRIGDAYYFRTIPRLTRRILSRGKPIPESPLLFTETQEQYREWQAYGRSERPMEREAATRPRNVAPPPAPAPIDRSINLEAPKLPPPELPSTSDPRKK
jgi:hypothetical protein